MPMYISFDSIVDMSQKATDHEPTWSHDEVVTLISIWTSVQEDEKAPRR